MSLPEIVTLEEAKAFCRIDHDDEDDKLQGFIDAATEGAVEAATRIDWAEEDVPPPERVKMAVLVHVLAMFEHPENPELPSASQSLLLPFRALDL